VLASYRAAYIPLLPLLLQDRGAEVVLALTHMRLPNDLRLAGAVPGIDVVLGGHDHDYFLIRSQARLQL
jgi:2',3'-cyclic-nucleotide 2'-phosphodiesterase (5'-nucleotidase family)